MATAPPADPEAPDAPSPHPQGAATTATRAAAAAARGLLAFGVAAAVGVAIGMAEYAATKGAYRPWTWIKVGFLYLLSFCGVGLHVDSSGPSTFGLGETHLQLRMPLMVGTALIGWLLVRGGRGIGERGLSVRRTWADSAAAALAFAVPTFLVSLPATLRFPNVAGRISPVYWEAAAFPLCLALSATAAGAFLGRRRESNDPGRRSVGILDAGWHMFVLSVGLAFIGFLVLAAVKPDGTAAYARFVRDSGRIGAVTVGHHLLLLPDQSIWTLGPAMGGSATVVVSGAETSPTRVTMAGIDEGALGLFLDPTGALSDGGHLALGGGFYLFLLVPLAATVLGGRRAAGGAKGSAERILRGAGAGAVFAALMTAAALFSASSVPLPLLGQFDVVPASIRAAMPSTALLALAWGVAGGSLGAVTSDKRRSRLEHP